MSTASKINRAGLGANVQNAQEGKQCCPLMSSGYACSMLAQFANQQSTKSETRACRNHQHAYSLLLPVTHVSMANMPSVYALPANRPYA